MVGSETVKDIQIQPMLRLNMDSRAVLGRIGYIQIQPMLRLNLKMRIQTLFVQNSNTTNVKVKRFFVRTVHKIRHHSNTTNVKVKRTVDRGVKTRPDLFKYNQC